MFVQITSFLLDVAAGLLGGACLLRMYMQYQRVPFVNPVGRFIFALTDWIVLPLCYHHHRDTSPCGLDRNVAEWEFVYGTQVMWIDRLIAKTGVDVWTLAKAGEKRVSRVCATGSTGAGLDAGDAAQMEKAA